MQRFSRCVRTQRKIRIHRLGSFAPFSAMGTKVGFADCLFNDVTERSNHLVFRLLTPRAFLSATQNALVTSTHHLMSVP